MPEVAVDPHTRADLVTLELAELVAVVKAVFTPEAKVLLVEQPIPEVAVEVAAKEVQHILQEMVVQAL
jgi:hypothetical protein